MPSAKTGCDAQLPPCLRIWPRISLGTEASTLVCGSHNLPLTLSECLPNTLIPASFPTLPIPQTFPTAMVKSSFATDTEPQNWSGHRATELVRAHVAALVGCAPQPSRGTHLLLSAEHASLPFTKEWKYNGSCKALATKMHYLLQAASVVIMS